jgi:uncharacterized protein YndB with AHSA1/START domain
VTKPARNEIVVDAPPERVWAVLADGHTYPDWVVGAADSRKVEEGYPTPGTRLHHTQILPKVGIKDTSEALESDPPRHLLLEVRVRPLLVSKVRFELEPVANGKTRVVMYEWKVSGPVPRLLGPLFEHMLKVRNGETLRRLRSVAEKD